MTYSAPLKATLQLVVMEEVGDGQDQAPQEHHREGSLSRRAADLTPLGTFVINGAERVVVSPAAPLAGRGVRGEHPPQRPAAVLGADHSVPRVVGRVHDRHSRRDLRPYRQEEEVPGHGAAARLRLRHQRRHPEAVLRRRRNSTSPASSKAARRTPRGRRHPAGRRRPESGETRRASRSARVGDELTLEQLNAMRHAGIAKVTVFAGYTVARPARRGRSRPRRASAQRSTCWRSTSPIPETGEVLAEGGRGADRDAQEEAAQGRRAQGRRAAARRDAASRR